MKKRALLFLSSLLVIFLSALPASGEEATKPPTMEVAGKASIMAMPNTVTILFSVETESSVANEAVKENAERTEHLLSVLKKVSQKETKIKTSGYSLFPIYEKEGASRTGLYRVRNTVILESKDLGKVGAFLDQAAEAGVSRIANVTFTTDKAEELAKEAATQALKNAIKDGEALAKAAGLTIKRILKISYDQKDYSPLREMRMAAATSQTPISVGEIQIQATVQVILELD